jgi:hypothetical protein
VKPISSTSRSATDSMHLEIRAVDHEHLTAEHLGERLDGDDDLERSFLRSAVRRRDDATIRASHRAQGRYPQGVERYRLGP